MSRIKELSQPLQEIILKTQALTITPNDKSLEEFSNLEYQDFIEKSEPLIKEELGKITDIGLINTFIQEVTGHNLPTYVFPDFVWNELSFAENIPLTTETYPKFNEKIRAVPYILSDTLKTTGGLNTIIEEAIPSNVLNNKYRVEMLIGKHDELIRHTHQDLWNDIHYVERILFDEDVPNRESIDKYSYIEILRRVPKEIINEELALRIAEKFQLGYSELPGEFQLKPDFAIIGLNHHIANIEAIPEETLNSIDVVIAAVKATKILDTFQQHPSDTYHPFGHLETLYKSKMFQKLNVHNINPFKIPGHSEEFVGILEEQAIRVKQELTHENKPKTIAPIVDLEPPKPMPANITNPRNSPF